MNRVSMRIMVEQEAQVEDCYRWHNKDRQIRTIGGPKKRGDVDTPRGRGRACRI
jgi:hypothetical protein